MNPVLNTTVKMHAHRCEECAKNGKEVVWIHPDSDRGQIAAHKCPECGTVNWKQSNFDNGKLPQPQPRNAVTEKISAETILGYAILLLGLALIGYGAYLYIQQRREKKEAGNEIAG